jgi:hypothetical protein
MNPTRRNFLRIAGLGAAGAAITVSVPESLEAQTGRAFQQVDSRVVDAVRRGELHPFFAPAPPADMTRLGANAGDAAMMKDAVDRPYQYMVVGVASGPGANGSQWESRLPGRVGGTVGEADIVNSLIPRGIPIAEVQGMTEPMYVPAGHSFRWDDPIATQFGTEGAGWMLIESSLPLSMGASYTFNQAADGTQQGQGIAVLPLDGILQNSRLAKAGDVQRFELYGLEHGSGTPRKRENWIRAVPPASGDVSLDYWIEDAQGLRRTDIRNTEVRSGEYTQANTLHNDFAEYVPRPGDSLVTRVSALDGETDVAVWQFLTPVDNLDELKQDPYVDEGSILRGIEEASVYRSSGEANDAAVGHIHAKAGYGSRINEVHIDWDGNGTFDNHYTGLDQEEFVFEGVDTHNPNSTGTFTPRMRVFFTGNDIGTTSRDFVGEQYTVVPEQSFIPENGYETTRDNVNTLASLFGNNVNVVYLEQMTHYGEDDMRTFLEAYTNGTIGTNDPELEEIELDDRVNRVYFRLSTGTTAAWGGFDQLQMKQLRNLYGTD